MPSFDERRLLVGMGKALVLANLRYWFAVAPLVGTRLEHWTRRAEDIPDPTLRRLALFNLREEGFNAQATATLATLVSPRYRTPVVEAIVALQVLYDYLDSLVEHPLASPMSDGRNLYRAFLDATALEREPYEDYYPPAQASDGGYLRELVHTVREALRGLPSQASIAQVCGAAAERCAEAQVRAHADASLDGPQLELWAREHAVHTPLGWREFLAGAVSSGLSLHALIALAANPRASPEQALALDALYLSLCSVSTVLDGLVDRDQDLLSTGRAGYLRYYADRDALSQGLEKTIACAVQQARETPDAAHHLVTLLGIVSYYASAPTARDEFARPAIQRVTGDLAPAIGPILVIMRSWRIAKRMSQAIGNLTGRR